MSSFLTLLIIGIGLSMDTFSLSIIYGTLGLEKNKIRLLSIIVGIYHFIMPLFGSLIGFLIINKLFIKPNFLVGIIFIIISIQMFFQKEEILDFQKTIMLFVFGLTVSIDSFSVGIGISAVTDSPFLSYVIFSLVSLIFTYIGLKFGRILNDKFGKIVSKIGAIILFALGVNYIV